MAAIETDPVVNDEDDDEALELLKSILPNDRDDESNSRLQRLRDDHIQRLQTYRPENFFAMPIELSPLLCTLCGWEVQPQAKRMFSAVLTCRNCEAVTAVHIPQKLPAGPAKEKLITHFQEQLWKSHQDHCMYQLQAKGLIMEEKRNLPRALARVLPLRGTSLDLCVAADSATSLWPLIYERYTEMAKLIQKQPLSQEESLLKIELPPHVQSYRSVQEGASTLQSLLFDRFRSFVREQEEEEKDYVECNDAIALAALSMVVFGWDPLHKDPSAAGVHCVVCRVQKPIGDHHHHGNNKTTTVTDWRQPLAAHRYFCPWVACSKAAEAPWWKVVVDTLLDRPIVSLTGGAPDSSSSWLEVHRLLKAGISKKRLKLNKDAVVGDC